MTTKLKPCPFCGGVVEYLFLDVVACWAFDCTRCYQQTRIFSATEQGAISAWNTRHNEMGDVDQRMLTIIKANPILHDMILAAMTATD